ncbi:MAG: ArnT family glycosyltransferase [Isosphaeraceae bacterium]
MNLSSSKQTIGHRAGSRLIPWLCLLAAIGWSILLRVPLVVNAPVHLDSDLAVDGLTLQEALDGHWRWHYPGTPYTGTGAVLLSWIPARIWGANPQTLVSGGTVAHLILLVGVFALVWRVFGQASAIGSLVPLTFASTGLLWLSGRITGGHLLIVAWSGWAWLLLYEWLTRLGWKRSIALGVWCGLGIYLDSMFALTLGGIVIAGLLAARRFRGRDLVHVLILIAAFLAGAAPRVIGRWVEPHDAYHEQFSWSLDSRLLADHSRILFLECLPRLVAGHRLPGLEADPDPALLGTGGPIQHGSSSREGAKWWVWPLVVLALSSWAAAFLALVRVVWESTEAACRAVAVGLLATALAELAGFLINRNIFNSDNYRYLVLLLIPWSAGCGLVVGHAIRRVGKRRWAVLAATMALAALYTCDAAAWYRHLGWIDESFRLVQRRVDDPAVAWLRKHPEIQTIFGSYWDVYRLSFLSGRKLKGVPLPIFPNRFPEWSAGLPGGRPETLLVRRAPEDLHFLNSALREGGKVLHRERGLLIVHWPWRGPGRTL